ncbi:MAG: AAA family ATPase [Flavobacteriales bacterium]|nr:AAA family ATPase [Flavobacteriales bacterium]
MRIKNIAAYRRQLQAEFNVHPDWEADFMGGRTEVEGRPVDGFFKFWQSSTAPGREAIAGKLRGVLEMAQNDQAIYEITQNAADCGATDLRLWYDDKQFLALNDGDAFDVRDVKSILDTFGSEKALGQRPGKEGMIGQYGVGFKLFHRLVGKESGLEELLDQQAGPMIFSWNSAAQLDAFLQDGPGTWELADVDTDAPWLFKILLTCFPAAPGEVVKDIAYRDTVAFTPEEVETFRAWARARLGDERPEQGSLFFLHLGEGKRQVLDNHMDEIRSCMGVSMHFLRKLTTITVNGDHIERVPLERIELRISRNELRELGFRDEHQDVELVFAYAPDAAERLAKEPTLYQYFPMTKEAHGMAYVIHSNALQKQAQRTELNADSEINARLLARLTTRVKEQALEWMRSDPEKYRDLFKVILASEFADVKLPVLSTQVQKPLIELVRQHVPTMDGGFVPKEQVRIRRSSLPIPAAALGEGMHWFHWTKDLDEAALAHARNSAKLNLPEVKITTLIEDGVEVPELDHWLAGLQGEEYTACLKELAVLKVDLAKHPDLPLLRIGDRPCTLNGLVQEPALIKELGAWYAAYPEVSEWLPRPELELAVARTAERIWCDATASILYNLSEAKAMQALLERLPEIVLDDTPTAAVIAFMDWWKQVQDDAVKALVRPRLALRSEDGIFNWDTSLVLERFKMKLPSGRETDMAIHDLLPAQAPVATQKFNALRDRLLELGYDEDFIGSAFKRKTERSKQDLQRIGDQLAAAHKDVPLLNGCQLVFAVALKKLHPQWTAFESLCVRAADGESYGILEWWVAEGPSFVDPRYLLAENYGDIRDYLGDQWEPIKLTQEAMLATAPRLGVSFIPDLVQDDLDAAERLSFLNWLLAEQERNATALDHIRTDRYKQMLEGIFGSHPGSWLNAEEEFTRVEERIPTWVAQWAGRDHRRLALVEGLRSQENATVAWRKALLNDEAEQEVALPSSPVDTLRWIVGKGGAETFVSALQETRITKLLQASGVVWKEEPALRLETDATESTDPIYQAWKAEGAGWTVYEYPGDLPLSLTWEGQPLARRHGIKFHAPQDGSQRIFLSHNYPIVVALYRLSEGSVPLVPNTVRDSFQRLFDKHYRTADAALEKVKERPAEELPRKQQVEEFRARQMAFCKQPAITLAELVNSVEWEYAQKLLDRDNGNTFRFKEVEALAEGVLILRRPNVAELPYELVSDKDRSITGMRLKLRKRGVAYQEITDFELLASSEGEVRVRVPKLPFTLNESAVALIELPVEDMLLKMLAHAWRSIANAHDGSRPLIELVKERAPGGQVGFIFGPPGTGKTTVLAERLISTVRDTEAKVLVLTPTNTAADVLFQRITEKSSDDFKVLQGVHRFGAMNKDVPLDDGYPAVVITTMHRFSFDHFANGRDLKNVDWDHVVFDEASMAALPYALLPLLYLPNTRRDSTWGALGARFLFAGDPFQLMPVGATPSMKDKIDASKNGQRIRGYATENIFTLAGINNFQLEEAPELPGARINRLATNYRSGKSIVQLSSKGFYDNGVSSARGTDEHDITLGSASMPPIGLWSFPVTLQEKDTASDDLLSPSTIISFDNSAVHVHSALLAARLAVVLALENPGKRVIIICPYGRQVRVCQALLEPFNEGCVQEPGPDEVRTISVSSVHRYQGGEAEIVIFLLNPTATKAKDGGRLVIGDIALFNDPNLINVAISRARDVLILLAPEDNISRTGHSRYLLMDQVLTPDRADGQQVPMAPSAELEALLFNGQTLEERVSIMPIRAMDLYRVQETRDRGTDLVVLHNKENLNMVMAVDIVMEGIDLAALTIPQPLPGRI